MIPCFPHLRRHFIAKSIGWGWGVFLNRRAIAPVSTAKSFAAACRFAAGIYHEGLPNV